MEWFGKWNKTPFPQFSSCYFFSQTEYLFIIIIIIILIGVGNLCRMRKIKKCWKGKRYKNKDSICINGNRDLNLWFQLNNKVKQKWNDDVQDGTSCPSSIIEDIN